MAEPRILRLGTRRSALALAQSGWVGERLEELHPGLRVELVAMETRGDRTPGDLAAVGGKGLFTEELEAGLLDDSRGGSSLDLAVHSLKDLPVHLPEGLVVAAYPRREDPRDFLVTELGGLDALPRGARVLTGSLRRKACLLLRRPDLEIVPVRGNVGTRLGKWREGQGEAVVLAAAGLRRLGLAEELPGEALEPADLLPAPGQGTLAVEVRRGSAAEELVSALNHVPTERAARAERHIVAAFGGDCTLPLAAWGREEDGAFRLTALLATADGRHAARGEGVAGAWEDAAEACLAALRRDGAEAILARLGR
jgi:hydroxymethylbilane synthase